MKISELIEELNKLKLEFGDLEVYRDFDSGLGQKLTKDDIGYQDESASRYFPAGIYL